jgi:hypothetical protein
MPRNAMTDDRKDRDPSAADAPTGIPAPGDDAAALERALERRTEDLTGDIEENRNLSGSTTYETLREEGDPDAAPPAP